PSAPWTAPNTSAQSSIDRQMGPSLSMVQARAMHPARLTRPKVGRNPLAPHWVHGETMLPSVSVPMAKPTSPATTADADPADEPLEPCFTFHGLRVLPPNHWSPMASAPSVSLATRTAPASSSRFAIVALVSSFWSLYGAAPHVVG